MEYICPNCKQSIYDDDAILCLYCGESLRRSIGLFGHIRNLGPKAIITTAIIALLLISTLILLK